VSRRVSTGATFKWLGDDLLADLLDYCACYHDTSPTFVMRKAVRAFLKAELNDMEKERAFRAVRNERLGIGSQTNVRPIRSTSD